MSKTIFMGEGQENQLTPEEQENLKRFSEEQLLKDKAMLEQSRLAQKEKNTATLEELLQTKVKPTEDRVVVYPDPVDEFTEGGLLKPQEVQDREKPLTGTVLTVGPGLANDALLTNKLLLALLKSGQFDEDKPDDQYLELEKEVQLKTIPYKPGDRVLYGRFAGTPVPDPATKVELLIMRAGDIFAKV
jgi:co-chaperonin GroES (HSP10)